MKKPEAVALKFNGRYFAMGNGFFIVFLVVIPNIVLIFHTH
jgi:hypothetical protein